MTAVLFAQRMGVSRDTLSRLEKGDSTIALGTYARALRVLGLDLDLEVIARDDELGRKLQDLQLPPPRTRGARTRSELVSSLSSEAHVPKKGETRGGRS